MSKKMLNFVLLSSVFQLGCSNREVLLESGTYNADSSAGVLGLLSSVSSDVIEDFEMKIDVGTLTAIPFSNQSTAVSVDLNGALLFASGCLNKKGATVQEAWLSTTSYQETVDVVGGMTGMLKLVRTGE
jgi:hypothetical protein